MKINDKQSVKLRTGSIRFKNHWKLLAVPFRIYADFESLLKWVKNNDRSNNTTYTKKYQKHNSCSFAHKVVCIDDKFTKPVVWNLVMSVEDERSSKSSNKFWT